MSEHIELTGPPNPSEHFAIAAIVLAEKAKDIKVPPLSTGGLDVTLNVNGVEVPFSETIKEIYHRIYQDLDRKAAELAYEKLSGAGLNNLYDDLRRVDWEIRSKIEDVFGVKLREDY